MPSARICPVCNKPMANGTHQHARPGNPAGVKDMDPVARTDTTLGTPPTKKPKTGY